MHVQELKSDANPSLFIILTSLKSQKQPSPEIDKILYNIILRVTFLLVLGP